MIDDPSLEAGDRFERGPRRRLAAGLSMRAIVPNAITAAALCSGLTGIRFAIAGDFEKSILAIILAGLLDGIDGRAARLLNAQTRFGAELDSLADSISFGVAPALIVYLWTLHQIPSLGWISALAFAICCVLRLARFNSRLDMLDQPHKSAGFLTGVPAPLGAGLAFLPMYLWIATTRPEFANPVFVSLWMVLNAFLMISSIPTLGWSRMRPPGSLRLVVIALVGLTVAALLTETWFTLAAITIVYLLLIPVGLVTYARIRRRSPAPAIPAQPVPAYDVPDAS
ncbi:CDP-diacylglycerol--serine O-phosphatidyltransferase [Novosphingobium sp. BL-52-GroH]|uniref:CDP-diacylglycerol--serine O-phosphatidyltransferase n=1 Tax=Novosphingobium sp. BL-52-GroH TaxID=3349877 RepID=UPI00384D7B5D